MGCAASFKGLPVTTSDVQTLKAVRPFFGSTLYKAEIDVTGHYLSGLLLIKTMPDSSMRLLFTNEMGITYFDFAFLPDGSFHKYSIIKQMDRKAVVKTLKKDFKLLLMAGMDEILLTKTITTTGDTIYIFSDAPDYFQYKVGEAQMISQMIRSSKRKDIVSIHLTAHKTPTPDSISITHHNFSFSIHLKKIER